MVEPKTPEPQRFIDLGRPRRIWAIGAVHADPDRLDAIHHAVAERFRPGDRLVYLGNMIGRGEWVIETVDRLIAFRSAMLAMPGMVAGDLVYLRGGQEEMWQKLMQLQFAPDPRQVLDWMLRQGVATTLAAYGGSAEAGMAAARGGTVSLGRWTQGLRQAMQSRPGHEALFNSLRRAAYTGGVASTDPATPRGLLFVSAGIDPARPLTHQGDAFWWGGAGFARLDQPYGGFRRLVRGYDPAHQGVAAGEITVTLDGGCGFGGTLVCGCFDGSGEVLEMFQA